MQTDPQQQMYEADYRVSDDGQIERRSNQRPRWRRALGPLVPILIFAATKLKFIVTAFKSVKFLGTGVTMLVSAGAYALLFPWHFAVGLVVLIFIHEMGHSLVLKRYGMAATAPIFIPFLGAFIGMKQLPKNSVMEAYVGLGGPILGSLGAFAAWGIYLLNGHTIFLVLAFFGMFLNLFNLLPILPLDGGRAVGALSRWVWVAGYALLIGLVIMRPSPILFIILLVGAPETWNAIRGRVDRDYYRASAGDRLKVATLYFGLILILGVSFFEIQSTLQGIRLR
jgi:Zn-dependent protease